MFLKDRPSHSIIHIRICSPELSFGPMSPNCNMYVNASSLPLKRLSHNSNINVAASIATPDDGQD